MSSKDAVSAVTFLLLALPPARSRLPKPENIDLCQAKREQARAPMRQQASLKSASVCRRHLKPSRRLYHKSLSTNT
jgi:hypothetical protein